MKRRSDTTLSENIDATRERVVELLQQLADDPEDILREWGSEESELVGTAVWMLTGEDRRDGKDRRGG